MNHITIDGTHMAVDRTPQVLHDSYGILKPSKASYKSFPAMKCALAKADHPIMYVKLDRVFRNCMHAHSGSVTMKMLQVFEDGNAHTVREVHDTLFPAKPLYHDMDTFKNLLNWNFIKIGRQKNGRKLTYEITAVGKEALEAARANDAYYTVIKLFRQEGDIYTNAVAQDLSCGINPLDPKCFVRLAKAIFDSSSRMRVAGSAYRWMNTIISMLKHNSEFYDHFNTPEMQTWLEHEKSGSREVTNFCSMLDRIARKRSAKHVA